MQTHIQRAREIANELELGSLWLETDAATELATLLRGLADECEAQGSRLSAIEFALLYYSEPHLYLDLRPRGPAEPILDGGLRARTALGLLKARVRQPARA